MSHFTVIWYLSHMRKIIFNRSSHVAAHVHCLEVLEMRNTYMIQNIKAIDEHICNNSEINCISQATKGTYAKINSN